MFPFTSPTLTLVLHLCLAALVYYDQRMNGRSGVGWAFLVFLLGVWGILIYILFNRDTLQLAGRRVRGKSLEEKLTSTTYRADKDRPDYSELGLRPLIKIETDGFSDQKLETLLRDSELAAAREYLENILRIAREMGDEDTVEKYKKYGERLTELEQSSRGWLVDNRDLT